MSNKKIYLFGHCNATEELTCLLHNNHLKVEAILDNNTDKQGRIYNDILVKKPNEILNEISDNVVVCISARAYASMAEQLERIGYKGNIYKLVNYNSFAEYSLANITIDKMKERMVSGKEILNYMQDQYNGAFRIICPFCALGDVYYTMSYLPYFLQNRNINKCIIVVIGNACAQVVRLFGDYDVEVLSQNAMDELIQSELYTEDSYYFIAHQDRPYVINLHKALYNKKIPLEQIYCCGIFGLPKDTRPYKPDCFKEYVYLNKIKEGKSVIISPYAKSVTAINVNVWKQIVEYFSNMGYQCFTNVAGDEQPLENTTSISPKISEMNSVIERAGHFVGIRSGMCDVLLEAKADKTALYPDYNYCDTRWKSIDIYELKGWKNIIVRDGFKWEMS